MHKPLAPRECLAPDWLSLVERPLAGMVNLRGSSDVPAFLERVGETIGFSLPVTPNRFVAREDMQCVWQGPNEWLLVVPDGRQAKLAQQLEGVLDGFHHAVTDVTGNRVVFRLTGANAITLLASGCSLDLAASSFPSGVCAQSILARTPVTILRLDDAPSFEIHARRSYRRWLRDWLMHAAGSLDSP